MKRCRHPALARAQPQGAAPPAHATEPGRAHWGSLHYAWQDATDLRDAPPGKEPLPAAVVIAIAEHRVRAIHELRDALERDPSFRQRIEALQPHARDAQGRNWNIPSLACGSPPRSGYEAVLRKVVDALRDQFDLA
jgi:hypothetical protein